MPRVSWTSPAVPSGLASYSLGMQALAARVLGEDRANPEYLAILRLLADAFAPPESGPLEVAEYLEAESRLLRGWVPDAEVTSDDLRELVSFATEALPGLPAGEPLTHDHLADVVRAPCGRGHAIARRYARPMWTAGTVPNRPLW